MRLKIIKIFEAKKGFNPLSRPKDAIDIGGPTVATGLSSYKSEPSKTTQENKEQIIVKKTKGGDYALVKQVNGIEVDSLQLRNLKDVKDILEQPTFSSMDIIYRVSNDDEEFIKAKEPQEEPQEEPLDINFGISHLLNNRDMGNKTYINAKEKQVALNSVVASIKAKLMNKKEIIKEIKELKSSEVVNDVSTEFLNGSVFKDTLDETSNMIRYVHYLVYEELTKYLVVNPNTKLLKGPKAIKARGGDISALIKELAKEIIPLFERYLNRKEKSELFNAFQEIKAWQSQKRRYD